MSAFNKQNYLDRLDEIIALAATAEPATPRGLETAYHSGRNIIANLYGKSASQLEDLHTFWQENSRFVVDEDSPPYVSTFRMRQIYLLGHLDAARGDLDKDLISNVTRTAFGSVIESFLILAREQLDGGYKDVAAVLVSAAFEDTMKLKAAELGIDTEGKELNEVVNALKAQAVFRGAQTALVTGFVRLRNNAMHAAWDKVQAPEVSSLIAFVEGFLLTNFS